METKTGRALVIGAGISGIRSALDLAEMNYQVFLIDKSPHIGGILSQLDYQFPTDHCGMCKMLPTIGRDSSSQFCLRKGLFHENIELLPATEMTALEGEPGNFKVTLDSAPSFIDPQKCIGCGRCSAVCPVEVADSFNGGLTTRKAVYLPVPHNIPNRYTLDLSACTRCGECEKVCPTGAIDLRTEARRAFKILVVDDELVVRDSLKEWLSVEGFSVDMAESGAEAIDLLSVKDYGLVLLDVKMPGMDGVEALQIIREMKPELPVLMMTAYATVETAVEAMKIGADEYLMKPFDIEALTEKVVQRYEGTVSVKGRVIEVGAVIMAAGSDFCDPAKDPGAFGYNYPNVITGLQFERVVSGSGAGQGRLVRPSDGKPARKVAFLQCIGSRDLKQKADYCSSVCCMFSIKEALLAKAKSNGLADTAIFYMDMRTFGKDFQRYRDGAEKESGVRFIRSRVHTVEQEKDGSLRLHYVDADGMPQDEVFDMVVLAAGQRPAKGTRDLAQSAGIELAPSGFCRTDELFQSRSSREGVFAGGSFAGLRDISESVIQAGSASLEASKLIRAKGGMPLPTQSNGSSHQTEASRDLPKLGVALCACASSLGAADLDLQALGASLSQWDPSVRVFQIERLCTLSGRKTLLENLRESGCNMVSIGACMPCLYGKMLLELAAETGLSPALMDVVDIYTPAFCRPRDQSGQAKGPMESAMKMSIERLRGADPGPTRSFHIIQKALVVGGGLCGLTAALSIADHGFPVDLVEKEEELGGLVRSLKRTIDGTETSGLLEKLISDVRANKNISVHLGAEVLASKPYENLSFLTTIKTKDGETKQLDHGVAILATGGKEAAAREYCYGQGEAVITQHELEERLSNGGVAGLETVAVIQCVGSREEGRNYCSRVCCQSALKNALRIKKENPDTDVYIFYRDIMTYGFLETYYTKARQEGVVFIRYGLDAKPRVSLEEGGKVKIVARDPVLGRDIAIVSDLLVLSTGIVPNDLSGLGQAFGFDLDEDGFFRELEYKWQPLNAKKRGIFGCGLAHSPRSISESIAMAQAAAQRALVMLNREELKAGNTVARVRHSICSLCERCIPACPYGARSRSDEKDRIEVDELACQGCGACAAVCPNSASVVRGFGDRQVMAMLDAALEF